MAVDPATLRLITGYGDQVTVLRARVLDYIQRVWGSLDAYRDDDITRFVNAVAPVVTGGQLQVAALTDAYLAAVEETITGRAARAVGVPAELVTDEAMRGVSATVVYSRSGPTVWTELSKGATLTQAANRGLSRALSMAGTDLQLAKTHASRHVLSKKDHVTGYRRVLEGGNSCGLCIVASTQRYGKEDLLPIHGGCDCSVLPIIGSKDPGQVIDTDALEDVHAAIQERFGASDAGARDPIDYRHVLVTHEHGEIGPVLAVRGHAFTGPNDL